MVRARLACVALVLVLGLSAGCGCFHRPFCKHAASDCGCDGGGTVLSGDGPMLGDGGLPPPGPGQGVIINGPPPVPQEGTLPLAPPPRLVPQAQPQAQPAPYVPR